MNLLYVLTGILAAGLLIYLFVALLVAGAIRMTLASMIQLLAFLIILLAAVKPLGHFMGRVYRGERTFLHPVLGPVERLIYRIAGIHPDDEMDWKENVVAMLHLQWPRVPRRLYSPAPAGHSSR